jgi:hypothetical protein
MGLGWLSEYPDQRFCTLRKSIWEQILEPAFLLGIGTGADLWTHLILESELAHLFWCRFWFPAQPVILNLGHTKQWVKQECTALKWEEEKNPRLHLWCIPSKNGNTLIGKFKPLILWHMSLYYCKSLKHTFYLKRVLTIHLTCNQKLRKEVKGSHLVSPKEFPCDEFPCTCRLSISFAYMFLYTNWQHHTYWSRIITGQT